MTVTDANPDAWSLLASYNHLPPEVGPAAGMNYFLAKVVVDYDGLAPRTMFDDLHVQTLGLSRASYGLFAHPESIPSSLDAHVEYTPGAEHAGSILWIVSTPDANGLVMYADPGWDPAGRVYFSLTP